MHGFRSGEAARLAGVSTDTVRRWCDEGRLKTRRGEGGHRIIDGADLARFLTEQAPEAGDEPVVARSARNRFTGLVTKVVRDKVAAKVELQCGPFRVVSLLTREAVDELGLEPGVLAQATVKSTNVMVELPSS